MPTATESLSTTQGRMLARDEIIRRAYQTCGQINVAQYPRPDQISYADDMLEREIDALQMEHVIMRKRIWNTLAVAANDLDYTLPASVLSIIGTMSLTDADGIEHACSPLDYDAYNVIPGRTTTSSTPVKYVHYRGAVPSQLLLYPVPDAAMTAKYLAEVAVFNMVAGSNTPDLERGWTMYLVYALASHIAHANSMHEVGGRMRSNAKEYKEMAKRGNRPRGPAVAHFAQRGPWR